MTTYYKLLFIDAQEISHAVDAQKMSSDVPYKSDYKKEIIGKGREHKDAYPEQAHVKKATDLASDISYTKDAKELKQHPNIPADHPDFDRAKQNALNLSDVRD